MESFITERDICDVSKENFLTYASEVLTDRAIPAAEDGLLSAQRKILWTMEDYLKMDAKAKTKKCNAIIGSTLATSYFHGDQACYGVLCKMSQEYLMRYPLIQGQGSLGTQENNDMVASSRYTEAKPSKYADLMFNDFKKNVVPLKETYNGEFMEPVVLPALFPNALCNGRQAIGISMSHNSLPHNLIEVCNAIVAYIQKGSLTTEEVMEYIKGPDFPLANTIINAKDIKTAFATGHSATSLKVRGEYEIKGNKVIFTTIPYRTYRNKIKEQITKNIEELEKFIEDFNDESSLGQNKLVFTIKAGINPEQAVLKLFAYTDLQTTISYNMNYIVNGTPKLCSIVDLIKSYVEHQTEVVINSTNYDLKKASDRFHVVEGLLIALEDLDNVITLIKKSASSKEAKVALIEKYKITEIQAKAILAMKLSSLANMERMELEQEKKDLVNLIEKYNAIINDKTVRDEVLIKSIIAMRDKYGDARRTQLCNIEVPKEEKEIAEVIPEDMVVVMSQNGDIKRIPTKNFKTQKRGGRGTKSEADAIMDTISTNTVDTLMFFSNKGKMYRCIVDVLPIGTNTTRGTHISNFIKMGDDEKIIAISSLHRKSTPKFVVFVTTKGLIKKTLLSEYTSVKKNTGIQAIKLGEGDTIASVNFMDEEELLVVSHAGMAIRFTTKDINPIGRVAAGVKSIKLGEGDYVVAGLPIHKVTDMLAVITENGMGKKVQLNEFSTQGRNGKGVIVSKDAVAGVAMVDDEDTLLLVGQPTSICFETKELPVLGRAAAGNIVIKNSKVKRVVKF